MNSLHNSVLVFVIALPLVLSLLVVAQDETPQDAVGTSPEAQPVPVDDSMHHPWSMSLSLRIRD